MKTIQRMAAAIARRGMEALTSADQLFQPVERVARAVGVQGRDAARMAGVPGLEQVEGGAVAQLADDDPVRGAGARSS